VRNKRQIGLRVRAHRLERRLTQEQLAEQIGRSVESISNLERGVSSPSETTLHRLARALEVPVEQLLLERSSRGGSQSLEFFQATEILKTMDERRLKLALNILKAIAND